jgi:hypothetical protein
VLAQFAITAYNACMQYTLRNVPAFLDRLLRRKARERGTSLNEVALEAMVRGAGLTSERVRHRNLRDLAGKWRDDAQFDQAIREQDSVDETLWR